MDNIETSEMGNPQYVMLGHIRTRYFEAGTGLPLVLIHGGGYDYRTGNSAEDWIVNFEALSQNFHVYAFDKIGAGQTDNPTRSELYTMETVIEHAIAFLEEKRIHNAVMVGHSRGALPAASIAINRPEMVSHLVLLDTNTLAFDDPVVPAGFYTRFYRSPTAVTDKSNLLALDRANLYSENADTEVFLNARIRNFEAQPVSRPMTDEGIAEMWRRESEIFIPSVTELKYKILELIRRGHLTQPCTVIWGFNDPSAPLKIGVDLYNAIAMSTEDADLHVINNAGHYPYVVRARKVEAIIRTACLGVA